MNSCSKSFLLWGRTGLIRSDKEDRPQREQKRKERHLCVCYLVRHRIGGRHEPTEKVERACDEYMKGIVGLRYF